MKRWIACGLMVLTAALSAHAISNVNRTSAETLNDDGNDIVYAEIYDNGDSVVFLKKDTLNAQQGDWSFFLYSLSAGDTRGVIKYAGPSVFYGFSAGPAQTVLYTGQPINGVRSIYYGGFAGDSALLVNGAAYPAYVSSRQTYNFAYVKDSNSIFVAGMQSDTAALSSPAVRVLDMEDTAGTIRYVRWSPDALSLVFTVEATAESTASIYVLRNVQTLAQKASANDSSINSVPESVPVRVTTDTYYNTNPHFVGGDSFVLYNRAIPYRQFKFSSFSDTGGCTSIILTRSNWDAVMIERSSGNIFAVDTNTLTSTVGSAANSRGYILLVSDNSDTDGDLSFSTMVTGLSVTAATSGTYYFPANVQLTFQAGAAPTSTFYVASDTPKSRMRYDTVMAPVSAVVVAVQVYASVPSDSIDKQKIQVTLTYQDIDIQGLVELSAVGLVHDTTTPNAWRSAGSTLNRSLNSVTITPPHFSTFAVGGNSTFDVVLQGQGCLIERGTHRRNILTALRDVRDRLLCFRLGRAVVGAYYGD